MMKTEYEIKLEKMNMEEIQVLVKEKTEEYNKNFIEEKYDISTPLEDDIDKALKMYGVKAQNKCFNECIASGDAMLEACKRVNYTVLANKNVHDKEKDITLRSIVERDKEINLLQLHKKAQGIGANTAWTMTLGKFNVQMLYWAAKCIGTEIKIEDIKYKFYAGEFEEKIKDGFSPTSNKKMLEGLNELVQAMVGTEYKAMTFDVRYLERTYTKKSRITGKVDVSSQKQLASILLNVCHRIVTNGNYDLNLKMENKK